MIGFKAPLRGFIHHNQGVTTSRFLTTLKLYLLLVTALTITLLLLKLPPKIVINGATGNNLLALTFDADMSPQTYAQMRSGDETLWFNSSLIDFLAGSNTPSTLFLTGLWIESHPQTTKRLADDPLFELANHSYSHPDFASPCFYGNSILPENNKIEEIRKTQSLLKELTGKQNPYFRFPNGCHSQEDLDLLRSLGLIPVQWSSYGPDTLDKEPSVILDNLKKLTRPGAIIVLHMHGENIAPHTTQVVSEYVPWAFSQGYTFVKLSQLLQ